MKCTCGSNVTQSDWPPASCQMVSWLSRNHRVQEIIVRGHNGSWGAEVSQKRSFLHGHVRHEKTTLAAYHVGWPGNLPCMWQGPETLFPGQTRCPREQKGPQSAGQCPANSSLHWWIQYRAKLVLRHRTKSLKQKCHPGGIGWPWPENVILLPQDQSSVA